MSDGRFSSKPLRSGASREVHRSTGEFAERAISTDTAQAFLQSEAVQREVSALQEQALRDIGEFNCAPLHRWTPPAARDLGDPLASATLVQEYLIGLLFLRAAGWLFMVFGAMFVLTAGAMLFALIVTREANQPPIAATFMLGGLGIAIGAVGAWFGILRGRVITEMCWFCPRGMIWMTDGSFDWYTWDDISDLFCDLQANRPAIGISFGRNTSWISFSNTDDSRQMVSYIEQQASAACAANVLQLIAEGKTVRFGAWCLSQTAIRSDAIDLGSVSKGDQTPRSLRYRWMKAILSMPA